MSSRAFSVRLPLAAFLLLVLQARAPAVAQVTKNLLANGSFDTSVSGWAVEVGPVQTTTWRTIDATGGPGSGSARVVLAAGHPDGSVALRQCVTLNGSARYATSLRTRTSAPRAGQVVVGFSAFDGASCDGNFLGTIVIFGGLSRGWETRHLLLSPPPGTHSYEVDLGIQSGPGAGANTVDFDDVFLGPVPVPPFACLEGPTTLCLDDSAGDRRFQIEARFAIHAPPSEDAHAIGLSGLGVRRGGLFWFFSDDNPELLIKVLNACALNERIWVFAAAGTNVAVDAYVVDTTNGGVSWLHNPANRAFPTLQDVGALSCLP